VCAGTGRIPAFARLGIEGGVQEPTPAWILTFPSESSIIKISTNISHMRLLALDQQSTKSIKILTNNL
jgi:hypothetical protein